MKVMLLKSQKAILVITKKKKEKKTMENTVMYPIINLLLLL